MTFPLRGNNAWIRLRLNCFHLGVWHLKNIFYNTFAQGVNVSYHCIVRWLDFSLKYIFVWNIAFCVCKSFTEYPSTKRVLAGWRPPYMKTQKEIITFLSSQRRLMKWLKQHMDASEFPLRIPDSGRETYVRRRKEWESAQKSPIFRNAISHAPHICIMCPPSQNPSRSLS